MTGDDDTARELGRDARAIASVSLHRDGDHGSAVATDGRVGRKSRAAGRFSRVPGQAASWTDSCTRVAPGSESDHPNRDGTMTRVTPSDPHRFLRVVQTGPAPERASGAVVLLHGRRAPPWKLLASVSPLRPADIVLLAPEAHERTWYPHRFLAPVEDNEPALSSALGAVDDLLTHLAEVGIPCERVVIVGFSQGACLAAEYVARHPRRYGGLAAIIGGLFGPEGAPLDYSGNLDGTPAFLCTADPDSFVPPERVRDTASVLEAMGASVDVRVRPGAGHVVTDEALEGVRTLVDGLGRSSASSPISRPAATPRHRERILAAGHPE
jgi:predicted esterase